MTATRRWLTDAPAEEVRAVVLAYIEHHAVDETGPGLLCPLPIIGYSTTELDRAIDELTAAGVLRWWMEGRERLVDLGVRIERAVRDQEISATVLREKAARFGLTIENVDWRWWQISDDGTPVGRGPLWYLCDAVDKWDDEDDGSEPAEPEFIE
jgi:hypothetical protein